MALFCLSKARIVVLLGFSLGFMACSDNNEVVKKAPKAKPAAAVVVGYVEQQRVANEIEAVGTLIANESVYITATVTDNITSVNFEDGQTVKKGDVLVTLTNDEQNAELAEAQANLTESIRQVERLESIGASYASKSGIEIAKANVEVNKGRLEITKARLTDRIISAPFSGVLGIRRVSVGALVTPGSEIARLDDISVLNLDFTVPEIFSHGLSNNSRVTATSSSISGEQFEGTVSFFDKRVDPTTRAVLVRAKIPNPDLSLLPGMLMNVTLYSKEYLAAIVPEGALQQVGNNSAVFVVKDDSTVEKRKVIIGKRLPGKVVVNQGLEIGETVVVDGTLTLRDGSAISIKNPELAPVALSNLNDEKTAKDKVAEQVTAESTERS
ncbi:efflux RND transporter periplasmic adaptor subunit [Pseudocolwellia sp. HL-MZ19]|uniref:efflux RND transporter periplasmic adaptor subunit n=1 Tax=unclassified Pseudocolwellia TaxID=2848178 RepID=UPI003CF34348